MPTGHAQLSTSAPEGTSASRLSTVDSLESTTQGTLKAEVQTSISHISAYSGSQGPSTSLAVTHKNDGKIRTVAVNQDRTHAVIAGIKTLKTIRLYENPLRCVEACDVRSNVLNQDWAPRRSRDTSLGVSRHYETYDLETAKRDLFDIEDVAWSTGEHKHHIATAVRNGKIVIYDLVKPGLYVNSYHDHLRQVHALAFNPHDGRYLLSGSQDGNVKLWDMRIDRPAVTFPGRGEGVRDVQWSPTNALVFAFGTDNGTVQHWTMRDNKQALRKRSAHDKTCTSIDWHPDGKHLASAGHDQTVKVWDMAADSQNRTALINFRTPQPVQSVRWRPACYAHGKKDLSKQSTQLATSYREFPFIHVWDVRRPSIPFREMTHWSNASTTDMCWRSRDLLWAVGPQGDFQQFDIPFAMKPVHRHSRSLHNWTAQGNLLFTLHSKPPKGGKKRSDGKKKSDGKKTSNAKKKVPTSLRKEEFQRQRSQSHSDVTRSSFDPLLLARTPEDDGLDEKFLGLNLQRGRRSKSADGRAELRYSVMLPQHEAAVEHLPTTDLKKTVDSYKPFKSKQYTYIRRPGMPWMMRKVEFRHLAQNYHQPPLVRPVDEDLTQVIKEACANNAVVARQANQYGAARSWTLLEHRVGKEPHCGPELMKMLDKEGYDDGGYDEPEFSFRRRLAKNDYTIRPIKHYDTAIPPVTEMFRRLIDYYAVKSDHLEGVSLLKLLLPILPQPPVVPPSYNKEPDEEALAVAREHLLFVNIPYGQAEALLQKHEKNLRARKLFVEAAYIRKLAHPHFPGAFAWAQQDKNISVGCSRCGAAINNPKDKLLCESCGTKSAGCGFCWQKESPYELPVSDKHSELTADELAMDTEAESWSGGTRLFNWCALCGHCIHAACAEICWEDTSEEGTMGKCPVTSCSCACVPGFLRDEQEREAEEKEEKEKMRARGGLGGVVLGEERVVGESRAVGRVRGALRGAVIGGGGGVGKKVRVVSPERK